MEIYIQNNCISKDDNIQKKQYGFIVRSMNYGNIQLYYIILLINNGYFNLNHNIAKLLSISTEEYENLLFSYNAYKSSLFGTIFNNKDDVIKCAEYLNNTYYLMLKLIGEA